MPASKWASSAMAAVLLSAPAAAGPLFDDLGGQPGLVRIVDGLMVRMLRDARIAPTLAETNTGRLKRLLVTQLCDLSGGPCRYDGRSMRDAHAGQHLRTAQFNAMVEALQDALDEEGVPFRIQNRLLALLAPMHRDMVDAP